VDDKLRNKMIEITDRFMSYIHRREFRPQKGCLNDFPESSDPFEKKFLNEIMETIREIGGDPIRMKEHLQIMKQILLKNLNAEKTWKVLDRIMEMPGEAITHIDDIDSIIIELETE